ncbi:50S ribosomal protein L31e [Candidatus Woesearchaeota archaeon]|nr:50S ribosomal protein L31e [Candidatus Woesearchaeota archaeon]
MVERTYVIPLRKEWLKVPKYKRAKKAVIGLRRFLTRHFRVRDENIKVGKALNEEIWKHGIRNPPSKVKVDAVKDDKGIVTAELFGQKFTTEAKAEPKKEKPKKEEHKKEDKPAQKAEVKKEEPKIAAKPKKEKSVEEKVKDVAKQKNKDPAVKKGEAKIKAELEKLEKQTAQVAA